MLTLVFGKFVSEAMVNSSLDPGLIAKETTMFYGHKFVFTRVLYEGVTKCWLIRISTYVIVVIVVVPILSPFFSIDPISKRNEGMAGIRTYDLPLPRFKKLTP